MSMEQERRATVRSAAPQGRTAAGGVRRGTGRLRLAERSDAEHAPRAIDGGAA
jgi:hypothetical protein